LGVVACRSAAAKVKFLSSGELEAGDFRGFAAYKLETIKIQVFPIFYRCKTLFTTADFQNSTSMGGS